MPTSLGITPFLYFSGSKNTVSTLTSDQHSVLFEDMSSQCHCGMLKFVTQVWKYVQMF